MRERAKELTRDGSFRLDIARLFPIPIRQAANFEEGRVPIVVDVGGAHFRVAVSVDVLGISLTGIGSHAADQLRRRFIGEIYGAPADAVTRRHYKTRLRHVL